MKRSLSNDATRQKLSDLQAQIEHAWREDSNYTLVGELAREHPDLAERLYDFFELLVSENERPLVTTVQMRSAAVCAGEHLEREGFADAAETIRGLHGDGDASTGGVDRSPSPVVSPSDQSASPGEESPPVEREHRSFLDYASKESGKMPEEVGAELGATDTFVEALEEHSENAPEAAQRELADRGAERLGLDRGEGLRLIRGKSRSYGMAASRDKPYESTSSLSYEEIVAYSGMTEEEKDFWLSLA